MIRHNLVYKILALAIATFLWAYVNAERNPQSTRIVTVPLQVRNLAGGYTAEPSVSEVSVTVTGPKLAVDAVRLSDVSAWIDLSRVRPLRGVAVSRAKVRVRVVGAEDGNLSVAAKPSAVSVRVEAIRSKRLPVELRLMSAPPLGYGFAEPVLQPAFVGVSGKASDVARVKHIVLPLTYSSLGKPIDGEFEVIPVDADGSRVDNVVLDTQTVHLKMNVVEVPATKTVVVSENIVGRPKYPAKVVRVSVVPPSVTIEGKPKILIGIGTIETEEISIEGASSSVTRQVSLRVPPGIRVLGPTRVNVTVTIEQGE
ncbi:MAG: CdaR family protein [Armatimonadota bacterium]|nr:CdaR family protein [Armatimonadota bacterium]